MGHHCCSKKKVKRGLWSPEEDDKLTKYITTHGHGCWSSVPKLAGLQRCGKSCRLRWINYLRPDLKRGTFTAQEERIIIDVHRILGNRWAQIAKHLPGRTDNEVKNFWNSCIKKKLMAQGLDPNTHNLIPNAARQPNSSSSNNNNNNNVSCFSQFNHPQLQPSTTTPAFTISSFDASKTNVSMDDDDTLQPAAFTRLPPHSSSFLLQESEPMSAFHYQDPNALMDFKNQSNSQSLLDYTNCSSSSSMEQANISPPDPFNHSEFMDEACMWGTAGNVVEPMQAPEKNNGLEISQQVDVINNEERSGVGMEMSYDSSPFDLELMDSALMPCGVLFSSGISSMEQLTWDC